MQLTRLSEAVIGFQNDAPLSCKLPDSFTTTSLSSYFGEHILDTERGPFSRTLPWARMGLLLQSRFKIEARALLAQERSGGKRREEWPKGMVAGKAGGCP